MLVRLREFRWVKRTNPNQKESGGELLTQPIRERDLILQHIHLHH